MILITGATGNIGRELSPLLLQAGKPMRVFAREEAYRKPADGAIKMQNEIAEIEKVLREVE